MAIYAIGDLQGCYDPLQKLLEKIDFQPSDDQIWFTGDIVNRGPKSLKTLRFVKSLGDSAITVLGNHDLHLVAAHLSGKIRKNNGDTIDKILKAKDCDELINWLKCRPLVHYNQNIDTLLVHAGVPPQWRLKKCRREAAKVEAVLRGNRAKKLLNNMYKTSPQKWSNKLNKWERRQFTLMALTRMRYVRARGKLELNQKGAPGEHQDKIYPWFEAPYRKWQAPTKIVFGHWATLGHHYSNGALCLDSGCVWGKQLIAARLTKGEEFEYTSVECCAK